MLAKGDFLALKIVGTKYREINPDFRYGLVNNFGKRKGRSTYRSLLGSITLIIPYLLEINRRY